MEEYGYPPLNTLAISIYLIHMNTNSNVKSAPTVTPERLSITHTILSL